MKKVFHLKTCDTCKRIIKGIEWPEDMLFQNIKEEHIKAAELDFLAAKSGGYEALFNKRAVKYRSEGWKDKALSESDYRTLILKEYTFLKRPVVVDGEVSFVGNAKATIADMQTHFN